MTLKKNDFDIYSLIKKELRRQRNGLELIASENFASADVMAAQGSVLTNKYAEGYPGRRYYGGCEYVDGVEDIARERVKKLFGAEHANVQPHSGTQANMAVYFAVLNPGDTIMGMHLAHGGHLSHGHPASFSGKYFKVIPVNLRKKDMLLDYNEIKTLARKHRPKLIVAGSSSYSRVIDWRRICSVAKSIGAYFMADIAHYAGLVAAGIYPSPVPYADFVTFTTHKTMRGPRGGVILCKNKFAKDIDRTIFPGTQGGPLMHVIAAKAVAFKEASTAGFRKYQSQVLANARVLAASLESRGLKIVSGGTDSHMFMVDVTPVGLTGKDAQAILESAGITVNKNSIPYDKQSPAVGSGIRIGTPAVTTRGMKEREMEIIGDAISSLLQKHALAAAPKNMATARAQKIVRTLASKFPLYPNLKS
ncbi:MAG: serine hydroxymethyltransferase [Endomicrobiia bacterium]|nr:serine hydroxymethyltransferase [Endomicrobiia bacterium]